MAARWFASIGLSVALALGSSVGWASPRAPLANWETAREEVARENGGSLPALELVFSENTAVAPKRPSQERLGVAWGHMLLVYRRPDGTQRAVEVPGVEGKPAIVFRRPEEVLYGADRHGIVHRRNATGIQIKNLTREQLEILDAKVNELNASSERGELKFAENPRAADLQARLRGDKTKHTNCTYSPSELLVDIGVLKRKTMFPKNMAVQTLEQALKADPNNVSVIHYERVPHETKKVVQARSILSPTHLLKSITYRDLPKRAELTIRAEDNRLNVVRNPTPMRAVGPRSNPR